MKGKRHRTEERIRMVREPVILTFRAIGFIHRESV